MPVDHNLSASWHNPKEIQLWPKQFLWLSLLPGTPYICVMWWKTCLYILRPRSKVSLKFLGFADGETLTVKLEIRLEHQAEHLPAARGFWKKNPFSGAILAYTGHLPLWCLWARLFEYPAKQKPAYLVGKGSVSIKLEKQDLWPACFLSQGWLKKKKKACLYKYLEQDHKIRTWCFACWGVLFEFSVCFCFFSYEEESSGSLETPGFAISIMVSLLNKAVWELHL